MNPEEMLLLLSVFVGLNDLWRKTLPNHFPSPEAKLYSPPITLLYFSLLLEKEYSFNDSLFKKKNEKFIIIIIIINFSNFASV